MLLNIGFNYLKSRYVNKRILPTQHSHSLNPTFGGMEPSPVIGVPHSNERVMGTSSQLEPLWSDLRSVRSMRTADFGK